MDDDGEERDCELRLSSAPPPPFLWRGPPQATPLVLRLRCADGTHFFWPHLAIVAKLPSVAVPMGRSARSGLPLSVQLVGPAGQDERLLRHAAALQALCGATRVPPGC